MKSEIYNSFASLNRGLDSALESLRLLQEHGVLDADYVERHAVMIEELKAGINHTLHDKLGAAELEDWTRCGKLRQEIEAKLGEGR